VSPAAVSTTKGERERIERIERERIEKRERGV